MSIFSTVTGAVSGFTTSIKDRVVQTAGNLKKSTEDFIGNVVLRSAFNRIKEGSVKFFDSEQAPESDPQNNNKEKEASFGSTGLVQQILKNVGVDSLEGSNLFAEQINGAINSVVSEVSSEAKTAVRQKIENTKPEDLMSALGSMLGNIAQEDSEGLEADSSFKLEGMLKIVGVILAVIGMLMVASGNSNVDAPKTTNLNPQPSDAQTTEQLPEEGNGLSTMSVH